MHYEINVSKNGKHFFATAERSILGNHQLSQVLPEIVERFPVDEGFRVTVTYCETTGRTMSNDELQNICGAPG